MGRFINGAIQYVMMKETGYIRSGRTTLTIGLPYALKKNITDLDRGLVLSSRADDKNWLKMRVRDLHPEANRIMDVAVTDEKAYFLCVRSNQPWYFVFSIDQDGRVEVTHKPTRAQVLMTRHGRDIGVYERPTNMPKVIVGLEMPQPGTVLWTTGQRTETGDLPLQYVHENLLYADQERFVSPRVGEYHLQHQNGSTTIVFSEQEHARKYGQIVSPRFWVQDGKLWTSIDEGRTYRDIHGKGSSNANGLWTKLPQHTNIGEGYRKVRNAKDLWQKVLSTGETMRHEAFVETLEGIMKRLQETRS